MEHPQAVISVLNALDPPFSSSPSPTVFPHGLLPPLLPPYLRGLLLHAKWLYFESTESPTTSAFRSWNSWIRSEKAINSEGQTATGGGGEGRGKTGRKREA